MADNENAPDPELGSETEQAMGEAIQLVVGGLASGQSNLQIVDQLVKDGWEERDAIELVGRVKERMQVDSAESAGSGRGDGGGGGGWLIWIGLLIFINLLSWLFDWPFWIY